MKIYLTIAPLALLLSAASVAAGPPTPSESCCACVAQKMTAPGQAGMELEPAFFCALITEEGEEEAFATACDRRSGVVLCAANANAASQDDLDCDAVLAEGGIGCPNGAKPAPVAGPPLLGGLVALLAGLGVWAAARRHRA